MWSVIFNKQWSWKKNCFSSSVLPYGWGNYISSLEIFQSYRLHLVGTNYFCTFKILVPKYSRKLYVEQIKAEICIFYLIRSIWAGISGQIVLIQYSGNIFGTKYFSTFKTLVTKITKGTWKPKFPFSTSLGLSDVRRTNSTQVTFFWY